MKKVMWGIVMSALLIAAFSATGADNAGTLYAGMAKVDITPLEEDAVDLSNRKLTLHDPLSARVLVLKNNDMSVAIVAVDLILFSSAKIVEEAKAKWNVDHVILSSTHTHSGMAPKGLRIGGGQADWTRTGADPAESVDWPALSQDPWYAATEEKIVAAIGEASKNVFPARMAVGTGEYDGAYLGHNRRYENPDGSITMLWANPSRKPTQPRDTTLGLIRIEDEVGKTRAMLVHYSCHAVCLMGAGVVSRDFPGAMVDYIEGQVGKDCMAFFLQGAEGDIDPYEISLRGEYGFNYVKRAGDALGKAALRLSEKIPSPATAENTMQAKESMVEIPYRRGNGSTQACLTTIVINKQLALVSIPGEPFVQHQLNITEKSPVPNTFVLGLAYSGKGCPFLVYIPTPDAVQKGGYGATECSFVSADAGDRMVNEALASINQLMAK